MYSFGLLATGRDELTRDNRSLTGNKLRHGGVVVAAGLLLTVIGVYGLLKYGTVLGANFFTLIGLAALYSTAERIPLTWRVGRLRAAQGHTRAVSPQGASALTIGAKTRVEHRPDRLSIVVRPNQDRRRTIIHVLWLVGWLFGEVAVAGTLITEPWSPSSWWFAIWLIGWTIAGPVALYRFLEAWEAGRLAETINFDGRVLTLYNDHDNLERSYEYGSITSFRILKKQEASHEYRGTIVLEVPRPTRRVRNEAHAARG